MEREKTLCENNAVASCDGDVPWGGLESKFVEVRKDMMQELKLAKTPLNSQNFKDGKTGSVVGDSLVLPVDAVDGPGGLVLGRWSSFGSFVIGR